MKFQKSCFSFTNPSKIPKNPKSFLNRLRSWHTLHLRAICHCFCTLYKQRLLAFGTVYFRLSPAYFMHRCREDKIKECCTVLNPCLIQANFVPELSCIWNIDSQLRGAAALLAPFLINGIPYVLLWRNSKFKTII